VRNFGFYITSLFVLSAVALAGCSKHHTDSAVGSSQLTAACVSALSDSFTQDVHPFLVNNCASCHSTGGTGKTKFAEADVGLAWGEFSSMGNSGIEKVYNNAISDSHAPGFTGSAIESEATLAHDNYEATLSGCASGITANSSTEAKTLNLDLGDEETLVWNLSSELSSSVSGMSGSFLFLDVRADAGGYYVISNPRIRTGPNGIIVRDVTVYINGTKVDIATLYRGVDMEIPAWTSESSNEGTLSLDSIILQTSVSPSTQLQLAFAALVAN
jgi:hypothetical protein